MNLMRFFYLLVELAVVSLVGIQATLVKLFGFFLGDILLSPHTLCALSFLCHYGHCYSYICNIHLLVYELASCRSM